MHASTAGAVMLLRRYDKISGERSCTGNNEGEERLRRLMQQGYSTLISGARVRSERKNEASLKGPAEWLIELKRKPAAADGCVPIQLRTRLCSVSRSKQGRLGAFAQGC